VRITALSALADGQTEIVPRIQPRKAHLSRSKAHDIIELAECGLTRQEAAKDQACQCLSRRQLHRAAKERV